MPAPQRTAHASRRLRDAGAVPTVRRFGDVRGRRTIQLVAAAAPRPDGRSAARSRGGNEIRRTIRLGAAAPRPDGRSATRSRGGTATRRTIRLGAKAAQVAAIEHATDRDGAAPDFRPGTNAQRHTARIGSKHLHAGLSKSSSLASGIFGRRSSSELDRRRSLPPEDASASTQSGSISREQRSWSAAAPPTVGALERPGSWLKRDSWRASAPRIVDDGDPS